MEIIKDLVEVTKILKQQKTAVDRIFLGPCGGQNLDIIEHNKPKITERIEPKSRRETFTGL